jgi:hypothetical protein
MKELFLTIARFLRFTEESQELGFLAAIEEEFPTPEPVEAGVKDANGDPAAQFPPV